MRLMIPLMLVLFISNLDATVVATAIPTQTGVLDHGAAGGEPPRIAYVFAAADDARLSASSAAWMRLTPIWCAPARHCSHARGEIQIRQFCWR